MSKSVVESIKMKLKEIEMLVASLANEDGDPLDGFCYYHLNDHMNSCKKNGNNKIVMLGKTAKCKNRNVCNSCRDWLIDSNYAALVVS